MKTLTKLLFVLLFSANLYGQDTLYVKVLISNQITNEDAIDITNRFQHKDVIVSRMDPTTNEYLCIYSTESPVSENMILNWFNSHHDVKCYITGEYIVGKIINLSKNCH